MVTGVAHAAAVVPAARRRAGGEHPGRAVAARLLRGDRAGRRGDRPPRPRGDHGLVRRRPPDRRRRPASPTVIRQAMAGAAAGPADDPRHHPDPPRDRLRLPAVRRRRSATARCCAVEEFKEKPSYDVAESYVKSGNYLWNAGMFVWRVDVFLAELARQQPQLHAGHLPDRRRPGTRRPARRCSARSGRRCRASRSTTR